MDHRNRRNRITRTRRQSIESHQEAKDREACMERLRPCWSSRRPAVAEHQNRRPARTSHGHRARQCRTEALIHLEGPCGAAGEDLSQANRPSATPWPAPSNSDATAETEPLRRGEPIQMRPAHRSVSGFTVPAGYRAARTTRSIETNRACQANSGTRRMPEAPTARVPAISECGSVGVGRFSNTRGDAWAPRRR